MIRAWGSRLAGSLLDLFLPPTCSLCGVAVVHTDRPVCISCREALEPLRPPFCSRCGQPVSRPDRCTECLDRNRPGLSRIRAPLIFGGTAQEAILRLKRSNRTELAAFLGDWILRCDWTRAEIAAADLLVPVPLHPARLARRGFNQSVLIARRLSRATRTPCDAGHLRRLRATPSQFSMPGGRERRANVEGAFGTHPRHPFAGRTICLVDDVATTGATLQACARTLLDAGASRVSAVAAARTARW